MITIELNMFATLVGYLPDDPDKYEIESGKTIQDLISDLSLPDDQIKLIFANGLKADRQYALKQGDRIGIFPPVGGG